MIEKITVFIPTFNRIHFLPKLLNSLKIQDYKLFKVLVIDDGSTDGTKELISEWKKKGNFKIDYYFQKNSGKHIAYNTAIEKVDTDFFLEIDSDDYLKPNALSTFIMNWKNQISKKKIIGIQCLCEYENGELIGTKFVKQLSDNYEIRRIDRIKGDKGMFYKTSALKQFSLPNIEGEVVFESILHNRVSRIGKTICLNKSLIVKQYLNNGLTDKSKQQTRLKSFKIRYNEFNYFTISLSKKIYYNNKYVKYSLLDGDSLSKISRNAINKNFLFNISILIGFSSYLIKKIKVISSKIKTKATYRFNYF